MVSAVEMQPTGPGATGFQTVEMQPIGSQAMDEEEVNSRYEVTQAKARRWSILT